MHLTKSKAILFLILTCAILLTGCSSQGAKIGQYDIPYSYVAENTGSIMIKNVHTAEEYVADGTTYTNVIVVECVVSFENFKRHCQEYGTSVRDKEGNSIPYEKIMCFDTVDSFWELVYVLSDPADLSNVRGISIGDVQNQFDKNGYFNTLFEITTSK